MTLFARLSPTETLLDHLRGVGELAAAHVPPQQAAEARLAGRAHDIGKATSFFQARLQQAGGHGSQQGGLLTHHAYVSGVFGAWVGYRRNFDALALFLTIARHHGDLVIPTRILTARSGLSPDRGFALAQPTSLQRELKAVAQQVTDLNRTDVRQICEILDFPDPAPFFEGEVWDTVERLYDDACDLRASSDTRGRFWRVNLLFSALIDADKKLAAQVQPLDRRELPQDLVDRYVSGIDKSSQLTRQRAELYASVAERIQSEPLDRLYPATLAVTAPTGSGKTLAVLNAALQLRERIVAAGNPPPRIIYALPFLNIIEQNHREVHRVLCLHRPYKAEPRPFLIQHHHLATLVDSREDTAKDEELDLGGLEERLLLMEAWDAEIVVTTFVQLFHTLAGYRNRFLKKLHNIRGSIIVLDEVQSIRAELWPLVRALLSDLRELGCTVICMTATQPRLVTGIELAPSLADWPTRVVIERLDVHILEDLADLVAGRAKTEARSRLIVLNTVGNSLKLYALLKKRCVPKLFYLSTNITPYERRLRVLLIRRALRRREPITLVSTQAVEAGVDLDFDEGYRDMGPLDSILQVAGRVNRNGERKAGRLFVFDLENGGAGAVYGQILPALTRRALPQQTTDRDLGEKMAAYFKEVEQRISQQASREWLVDLATLRYCDEGLGLCAFNLIEERPQLPIFVELNGQATRALGCLRAALGEQDQKRRRWLLRRLQPHLESFSITPYERRAYGNMPPALFTGEPDLVRMDYRHIAPDQFAGFYDLETGYKWEAPPFV